MVTSHSQSERTHPEGVNHLISDTKTPQADGLTSSRSNTVLNFAAYRFVQLQDLPALKRQWLDVAEQFGIKGTVLLAEEGINFYLAGQSSGMLLLHDWLERQPAFQHMPIKVSVSEQVPFKRFKVKIKQEIIRMNDPAIRPGQTRAPAVSAEKLKHWLDQGHDDDGRPVVLMDTRNDFEVDHGAFESCVDFGIQKFSDFPAVAAEHREAFADKTVVTYCTGGIRCEKAALSMQAMGYSSVYQLDGGILKYFETVGRDHYRGGCFVFDDRLALDASLQPVLS